MLFPFLTPSNMLSFQKAATELVSLEIGAMSNRNLSYLLLFARIVAIVTAIAAFATQAETRWRND
jgi:hypothetical protein